VAPEVLDDTLADGLGGSLDPDTLQRHQADVALNFAVPAGQEA
jgi:hypothetical protein